MNQYDISSLCTNGSSGRRVARNLVGAYLPEDSWSTHVQECTPAGVSCNCDAQLARPAPGRRAQK